MTAAAATGLVPSTDGPDPGSYAYASTDKVDMSVTGFVVKPQDWTRLHFS